VKFVVDMPLPPDLAQWLIDHSHIFTFATSDQIERRTRK
jgi:hypothetical protein